MNTVTFRKTDEYFPNFKTQSKCEKSLQDRKPFNYSKSNLTVKNKSFLVGHKLNIIFLLKFKNSCNIVKNLTGGQYNQLVLIDSCLVDQCPN